MNLMNKINFNRQIQIWRIIEPFFTLFSEEVCFIYNFKTDKYIFTLLWFGVMLTVSTKAFKLTDTK